MKNEILVFIFDGYADWECAYVCPELRGAGFTVRTVAENREICTSMGGLRVVPDYTVDDFPADFSLLLLPGGNTWLDHGNRAALPVTEYAMSRNIPVAAICNACNFMAEHGYLDHIQHTGNTTAFMKSQAPHYEGESHYQEVQAVCDSRVVTANGTSALEFTREILRLLAVKPEEEIDSWYRQQKTGYYPYPV